MIVNITLNYILKYGTKYSTIVELYIKNHKIKGFNPFFVSSLGFGFFGVCGDCAVESELSFSESWVMDFGSF